jgi:hypothetical protein
MKLLCRYCHKRYDTSKGESAVWCEFNPKRGRGAGRLLKRAVTITVLVL